jgi:hypothetical protein
MFGTLHDVLQIVFRWADCHAHSFTVSRVPREELPKEEPDVRPFLHPVTISFLSLFGCDKP